MNKIVMCLVFISCSSLFSMDASDITVKLLDDDGNIQAERQAGAYLLKRRSNTIKKMFNDISVSEISISASALPVKTWDEIQSLWTLWYSKDNLQASRTAVYGKLAAKKLDEMVRILNSLEYLGEPAKDSVSSVAITALVMQIQEDLRKGHEPVLQQLKPRISRLVIDSMFSVYKPWNLDWIETSLCPLAVRFEFTAPEHITIPQATILLKIMRGYNLQSFKINDKKVNEKEIYKSLDKVTRDKMEDSFEFNHDDCTIL